MKIWVTGTSTRLASTLTLDSHSPITCADSALPLFHSSLSLAFLLPEMKRERYDVTCASSVSPSQTVKLCLTVHQIHRSEWKEYLYYKDSRTAEPCIRKKQYLRIINHVSSGIILRLCNSHASCGVKVDLTYAKPPRWTLMVERSRASWSHRHKYQVLRTSGHRHMLLDSELPYWYASRNIENTTHGASCTWICVSYDSRQKNTIMGKSIWQPVSFTYRANKKNMIHWVHILAL